MIVFALGVICITKSHLSLEAKMRLELINYEKVCPNFIISLFSAERANYKNTFWRVTSGGM